jgi:hypothetical protein
VGEAGLPAESLAQRAAHAVERRRGDGEVSPAAIARQVLALLGAGERVQARPVTEVDVADEPELLERCLLYNLTLPTKA